MLGEAVSRRLGGSEGRKGEASEWVSQRRCSKVQRRHGVSEPALPGRGSGPRGGPGLCLQKEGSAGGGGLRAETLREGGWAASGPTVGAGRGPAAARWARVPARGSKARETPGRDVDPENQLRWPRRRGGEVTVQTQTRSRGGRKRPRVLP